MEWVALARAEDPENLVAELTTDTLVGRFSGLDIHILHGWEKPACMREIGRIREQEFRAVGAGRNVSHDVDHLDLTQGSYRQLIAWDPVNQELVSMYRFADTRQILREFGIQGLRTHTLFTMSPAFQRHYLDRALELGRSVVNRRARRSIAGLYAVWSGLGILHRELPHVAYFFGNITLPADLPRACLDALVHFLQSRYSSPQLREMLAARPGMAYPLSVQPPKDPPQTLADLRALFAHHGTRLPAILVSYLNATDDLHVFDTARDEDFGNAWETALAIPTAAVTAKSRQRFVDGYTRQAGGYFDQPSLAPSLEFRTTQDYAKVL
ncbi:GNAT family N-acetyltransferase [Desulfonatronum thioautotrophicum]|uniref:GNAT family N-acetyltransferase n=1 Tax=Desulfonatronum thioautotrophicum TaxID=617001 RepID=UPI0005EBBC33|nr:GNAT family N-acetyltransferase [Desulfonatronum thioautotrophicum]